MTRYTNGYRQKLIEKAGLLVATPTFVVCFIVGVLENRYLTGSWTVAGLIVSLVAGLVASVIVTFLVAAPSVVHCPSYVDGDGRTLVYQRFVWSGLRPRACRIELPLASVRMVGPTAWGATRVNGRAIAREARDVWAPAIELNERLLLAPETAEILGLKLSRSLSPGFVRTRDSD